MSKQKCRRYLRFVIAVCGLCVLLGSTGLSQIGESILRGLSAQPIGLDSAKADSLQKNNVHEQEQSPPVLIDSLIRIPRLEFHGLRLYDALTALARAHNLSLFVEPKVTGTITMRLENVTLNDALLFIIKEYKLAWEKTGEIIKIHLPEQPPPSLAPLNITFSDGKLTANLKDVNISRLIDSLIDLTGHNIVLDQKVSGRVTGKIADLPLAQALKVLLSANGYSIQTIDDIMYVSVDATTQAGSIATRSLQVSCENSLVSVDIANSRLSDVLSSVSRQCGISMSVQAKIEGTATARFDGKDIDEALTYLLLNTPYTFRQQGGVYFVGDRTAEDLQVSKLVHLKHLIAGTVQPLIPASLAKEVSVKVVKEHNGLLLTGARTSIARVESSIEEVDVPMAQVLFEVIVVDYSTTERAEFSLTANNYGGKDGPPSETYYPSLDFNWNRDDANRLLRSIERRFDVTNLGRLPEDFFVRLRMMEQEGKANVRSHPRLAALNGHPASLEIGTTQYYLLESQTIYPSEQTNITTQTSQRFETVEANLSLKVVPYVNSTRELIVDVQPEFNTPVGEFNSDVPPTINKRILNSTVRLKDGETIVLGGLMQTTESAAINKFPILGSIPILGRIFQNRTSTDVVSELMIYVTPHIYFGSEARIDIDSLIQTW